MKNIIFIFSLPRSGSTLLQKILMSHSKIDSVSEPWILLPFLYTLKPEGVFTEYDAGTCYRAIQDFISNMPNKEQDYINAIRSFAISLYDKICDPNARYFLDKTPRYYLIIQLIADLFPNAKFIFLFRNPLEVLASIIKTWGKGKFKIYHSYLDLYEGPKLLAQGYRQFKERSLKIRYNDLVISPEATLRKIFEYLELEYKVDVINYFSKIKLKGRMGDPYNYRYIKIEKKSLENWKKILCFRFRRFFAKRYLKYLGESIHNTFGFDINDLLSQLKSLKVSNRHIFSDILNYYGGALSRILELPMQKKRLRNLITRNERLYLHS